MQRCQQSTAFQEAMEVCHAQPDFQWSGDLASLLITPIQRVPRYVLLLDRLRSLTSRDHATFAKIDRAVANMTRLAEFVNNQKTEADNKVCSPAWRLVGASRDLLGTWARDEYGRSVRRWIINVKGSWNLIDAFSEKVISKRILSFSLLAMSPSWARWSRFICSSLMICW